VSAHDIVTQASVPMMDMSASQISTLVASVNSSRLAGSLSSAAANPSPPLAPLNIDALGHASSAARPSGMSLNVQKVQANISAESDVSKIPIALKVPVHASGELGKASGDSKPAYESDDDDGNQEESDKGEEGDGDDDEVSIPVWKVISPIELPLWSHVQDRASQSNDGIDLTYPCPPQSQVYDSKPWGRRASPSSQDDGRSQGVTTRSTVISQYLIEDLR